MTNKAIYILAALAISFGSLWAREPEMDKKAKKSSAKVLAEGCAAATSQADLNINNVRARILGSGDMWWDLNEARFEVPKGGNRHSMFAGALWLGGIDQADNLRIAAMTYRQRGVDYWPGPLTENAASTTAQTCERYNRHWVIYRDDVQIHRDWIECKNDPNCDLEAEFPNYGEGDVPEVIKQWPGNGVDGELPNKLAPFYDGPAGTPGVYEWQEDWPAYDLDGTEDCQLKEVDLLYGDQTIWWVYNDKGNIHTETQAAALGFEIRAQAFAFSANDEINNMTFNNYRILNRSTFELTDTYFGTWFDPDLGNPVDDIIGCDIARGLGYCYNATNNDAGPRGYGLNPPAIGFDFFQGPFADYFDGLDNDRDGCVDGIRQGDTCISENPLTGLNERIIMSGFMYYNNGGGNIGPPGSDPRNGQEFYNYLRSRWRNGNNLIIENPSGKANTANGDGYVASNVGTATLFAYPGMSIDTTGAYEPFEPVDWWESPDNQADKRGLHCAGPFSLAPGALNFITTGTVWARDFSSSDIFSSVEDVIVADDKAQQLFDNCFQVLDGPDSPVLEIIELDRELVLKLNNAFNDRTIGYRQTDPAIAGESGWNAAQRDSAMEAGYFDYVFEGFQIFQVSGPDVGIGDVYDQSQSRLIWQSDIQNNIGQLVNYDIDPDLENGALVPQDMTIEANNNGIELTFRVTEDAFAQGDRQLVNNREYYFFVVAYSQNQFKIADPRNLGDNSQKKPYLAGRRVGNGGKAYLGIPSQRQSITSQSQYGDGLPITRVDGAGTSGNYLRLTEETRESIARQGKIESLEYEPGSGPVNIKVVDPRIVPPGDYTLRFDGVEGDSRWRVTDRNTGELLAESNFGLNFQGEQAIDSLGISIDVRNVNPPGFDSNQVRNNGFVGADVIYSDGRKTWLSGVSDDDSYSALNWILAGIARENSAPGEYYNDFRQNGRPVDPFGVFEGILQGTWAPLGLVSDVKRDLSENIVIGGLRPEISGTFIRSSLFLENTTPNIDIVVTRDPSLWTRVPVIELGEDPLANEYNVEKFRLRGDPNLNLVNGQLVEDSDPNNTGWSYFPGYAVNVETGRRLHMAFGENSWLKSENGGDMLWNPSPNIFRKLGDFGLGGMHVVYVFKDSITLVNNDFVFTYDPSSPDLIADHPWNQISGPPSFKFAAMSWVGFPLVSEAQYEFQSYADIPTDLRVELRTEHPYKRTEPTGVNDGFPHYNFTTRGSEALELTTERQSDALDLIRVVPNPYYGYSEYEDSQLDNIVKITNLPPNCRINIFMTNGTLVRSISKDNSLTFVEWDLTNDYNVPIASGIYLIHIDAGEAGQKVVKWMGAMRPVDLNAF